MDHQVGLERRHGPEQRLRPRLSRSPVADQRHAGIGGDHVGQDEVAEGLPLPVRQRVTPTEREVEQESPERLGPAWVAGPEGRQGGLGRGDGRRIAVRLGERQAEIGVGAAIEGRAERAHSERVVR